MSNLEDVELLDYEEEEMLSEKGQALDDDDTEMDVEGGRKSLLDPRGSLYTYQCSKGILNHKHLSHTLINALRILNHKHLSQRSPHTSRGPTPLAGMPSRPRTATAVTPKARERPQRRRRTRLARSRPALSARSAAR